MLPTNTTPAARATLPHGAAALFYEWWGFYSKEPENEQAFFGVCEVIRQALKLEPNYFEGVVLVTLDASSNSMTPTVTLHVDSDRVKQAQLQLQQQQPAQPQAPTQPQMQPQNFGNARPIAQQEHSHGPDSIVDWEAPHLQQPAQQPAQQHPNQFVQQMPPPSHQAPVPQVMPSQAAPQMPSVHIPADQSVPVGTGAHNEVGMGNLHTEQGPQNETIPVSGIRGHVMGVTPFS